MSDEVIAELRREIDALRARVFELEGDRRASAEPVAPVARLEDARVSRRGLLGKAGVAGVAGVAGLMGASTLMAQPAAAATDDDIVAGRYTTAGQETYLAMTREGFSCLVLEDDGTTVPANQRLAYLQVNGRKRSSG